MAEEEEVGRVPEHILQGQLFSCEEQPETQETAGSPNILNISTKQPLEQRFSYPGCSEEVVEFGQVVGNNLLMSESEVSEFKARSTLDIKALNQEL